MPPIEGHGTPRPRAALLALAAVLLVGGALRIHHLSYGLPQSYHPDEAVKLIRLRPIVHGDIVLDYLHHPSFMLYSAGAFSRAAALVTGAELDDQHILRYSRLWIALLGTATIAVAYEVARRLTGDHRAALAAAALLAVTPAAVVLSHHIKEDVPLTLWLLAGLIPLVSLARRGRRRDYLAMGVVLGMAAATKYIGAAMLLVPVIVMHVAGWRRTSGEPRRTYRHLDLGLLLLVASTVFLAWNFSILLGPQNFTRDFGQEIDHLAPTHSFAELLNFPLSDRDLGPVLLVLAAGALGATFLAAPPTGLLLAVVSVLWFLCGVLSPLEGLRYALPFHSLVPILVAVGAAALAGRRARLRPAIVTAVLVTLAFLTSDSVTLVRAMDPDTRALAREYLEQELPRGSRILFVGNKLTVPWAWMLSVLIEGAESTAGDRDEGADYLLVSRFTYQPIPGVLEAELGRLEEVRHWRNPGLHDQTHNPRIALYRLPGGAHETQIEPCDDVSAADEVSAVLRRRERAGTSLTEFPHAELPANACVELIEMPLKGTRLRWTLIVPEKEDRCLVLLGGVERLSLEAELRTGSLPASRARQLIEAGYRLSFAAAQEGDLPHDLDLDPRAMRAQLAAEREGGAQRLAMAPVEQLMLRFFADGRDVRHVGTFSPPLDARVARPLGMLEARALLVVEAMRHAARGEPSEHARAIAAERLSEIALRSPGTNMAELSLALLTRCWGALAGERVAALQDAARLRRMRATLQGAGAWPASGAAEQ